MEYNIDILTDLELYFSEDEDIYEEEVKKSNSVVEEVDFVEDNLKF